MEDICIKCGEKGKKMINLLCVDCYQPKIVIPKIEIEVCKHCGRVRIRGKFVDYSEEEIEEYVEEKIKGESVLSVVFILEKEKAFITLKENPEVEVERDCKVRFVDVTCKDCSRMLGGYYEAIIQLRGNWERIKRIKEIVQHKLYENTFISKEDIKKEGIDLYVGSSKHAIEVIRKLGLKYKLSRKLAGMREGKRLYRLTIAVKL